MKKIISLLVLTILILPTIAKAETSITEKFRPFLISVLGEERTQKLIGKDPTAPEVAMPQIPVVDKSATSLKVYQKAADINKVNPEIEAKFNYAYILEVFKATRQQEPNENDIAKTMNILSQGGTRSGVYRSLVLDETYGGMENWPRPVKKNSAEEAILLFKKFVNKEYKLKNFEGMNIFTLKRILTENFLEVADAFENRADLEAWYAVFSSEVAKKYPTMWQNETRKNTSALFHQEWASKVPAEHIKSELIIKLHTIFNTIN